MVPPEVVAIFKDWPSGLLLFLLASPFLIFAGVVITVIVQRIRDRNAHKVAEAEVGVSLKVVEVSEKEAATHEFQAIIDGFRESIAVISDRAKNAESKAEAAEAKATEVTEKHDELVVRVRHLEDERHDAIDHVILLEGLITYPPGPPPRPEWMRKPR